MYGGSILEFASNKTFVIDTEDLTRTELDVTVVNGELPALQDAAMEFMDDNTVYMFGGRAQGFSPTYSDELWMLDLTKSTWSYVKTFDTKLWGACMAVVDEYVVVLGGLNSSNSRHSTIYVYDTQGDILMTHNSPIMMEGAMGCTHLSMNGGVIVVAAGGHHENGMGGWDATGDITVVFNDDVTNPATWQVRVGEFTFDDTGVARPEVGLLSWDNSTAAEFFIFGGQSGDGIASGVDAYASASVTTFSPYLRLRLDTADLFASSPSISLVGTAPTQREFMSSVEWDGALYIYGGCSFSSTGSPMSSTSATANVPPEGTRTSAYAGQLWSYNYTTLAWTLVVNGATGLCGHSAIVTDDGQLYLYGGLSSGSFNSAVYTADLTDPSPSFSTVVTSGVIPADRWMHSAVYHDGKMIVSGGLTKTTVSFTCDSATNIHELDLGTLVWTNTTTTCAGCSDLPCYSMNTVKRGSSLVYAGGLQTEGFGALSMYELELNSLEWSTVTVNRGAGKVDPPPRGGAGTLYIESHDVLVLVGGTDTGFYNMLSGSVVAFDFATGDWANIVSEQDDLPQLGGGVAAAVAPGHIVYFGGRLLVSGSGLWPAKESEAVFHLFHSYTSVEVAASGGNDFDCVTLRSASTPCRSLSTVATAFIASTLNEQVSKAVSVYSSSIPVKVYFGGGVHYLDEPIALPYMYADLNGAADGSETTIDCGGSQCFLLVGAVGEGTYYLSDLTLVNGSAADTSLTSASYGGCVYIGTSSAELTNVAMSNCYAPLGGGAVYVTAGSVEVTNVTVTECESGGSGGAFMFVSSTGRFSGATLSGNSAAVRGGALDARFSTLMLFYSTVTGNSAFANGGAVGLTADSELTAYSSTLSNNSAADVDASGGAVYCNGAEGVVVLSSSELSRNVAGGECELTSTDADCGGGGGAVASIGCSAYVADSTLDENSGYSGGGLHADGGSVYVFGSSFSGNAGHSGGAVHLTSTDDVVFASDFAGTEFAYDSVFGSSNLGDSSFSGNAAVDGGAVYLGDDVDAVDFGSSVFNGNSAERGGGAIFWTDAAPNSDAVNTANSATYGSFWATAGRRVAVDSVPVGNLTSGSLLELTASIVDELDQVVASEHAAFVTADVSDGSTDDYRVAGGAQAVSSGVVAYDSLRLYGDQGEWLLELSSAGLVSAYANVSLGPCALGAYLDSGLSCSLCAAGTYDNVSTDSSACVDCDAGTFAAASGATACESCPAGSEQLGTGATTCSECLAGYFRNGSMSSCSQCDADSYAAAKGSTTCVPCGEGEEQLSAGATTCSDCLAGYFRNSSMAGCAQCPVDSFSPAKGAVECTKCSVGQEQLSAGATGCEDCLAGWFRGDGDAQCSRCPAGSVSAGPGLTDCDPCEPGTVAATSGLTECSVCAEGEYAAGFGSSSCLSCPGNSSTSNGGTGCRCDADFYGVADKALCEDDSGEGACCRPCPEGADCTDPENIEAKPGWWQPDASSAVFYECDNTYACPGGSAGTCNTGHTGLVCGECEDGYQMRSGVCDECPGRGASVSILAVIIVFIFVGFGLAFCFPTSVLVGCAESVQESKVVAVFKTRLKGEAKIIIGFLQVLSQINTVYDVPWPLGFARFIDGFSFVNLDIVSVSSLACISSVSFYTRFLTLTIGPLVVLAAIALIYPIDSLRRSWAVGSPASNQVSPYESPYGEASSCSGEDQHEEEEHQEGEEMGATGSGGRGGGTGGGVVMDKLVGDSAEAGSEDGGSGEVVAEEYTSSPADKVWKVSVFFLLLIYPGVSATILQLYKCRLIEGAWYLDVDITIVCYEGKWVSYAVVGGLFGLLYVVGIPLFVFVMLTRKRAYIIDSEHDEDDPEFLAEKQRVWTRLGFVFDTYKTSRTYNMYFELWELLRKLLLGGVLIFVAKGTASQIVVALAICVLALIFHTSAKPFRESMEDWLQFASLLQLVVIFFVALILKLNVDGVADGNTGTLGGILIFITVAVFVLGIGIVFFSVFMATKEVSGLVADKVKAQSVHDSSYDGDSSGDYSSGGDDNGAGATRSSPSLSTSSDVRDAAAGGTGDRDASKSVGGDSSERSSSPTRSKPLLVASS